MIYKLLHDYFQHDSFNKISTKFETSLVFPAISICNLNYINYTKLSDYLQDDPATKNSLDAFLFGLTANGHDTRDPFTFINKTAYDLLEEWENNLNESVSITFRNRLYDMMIGKYDFVFGGAGMYIPYSNWSLYDGYTKLGNCLEMNDDGSLEQIIHGKDGGLTVDLDTKSDNYIFTAESRGFVAFIRDQDETVLFNQGGTYIQPGTETFLKISKKKISRLGDPYGTCKDTYSKFSKFSTPKSETVRECIQRQFISFYTTGCGCIPWYVVQRMGNLEKFEVLDDMVKDVIARPNEVEDEMETNDKEGERPEKRKEGVNHTKKLSGIEKLRNVVQKFKNSRSNTFDRSKREESGDEGFDQDSSGGNSTEDSTEETELWPTLEPPIDTSNYTNYTCSFALDQMCDFVIKYLTRTAYLEYESCSEPCSYDSWDVEIDQVGFPSTLDYFTRFLKHEVFIWPPPTFEYAQDNLARIHIYYAELKEDVVEQEKAYEVQNFVAEFGGTVDLFIGFSFFTVFQLVEIMIAWCVFKCCRRKKEVVDLPSYEDVTSPTVIENAHV
eukprot:sb/3463576/